MAMQATEGPYQRLVLVIDTLLMWIGGTALVLMMLHITADVLANLLLRSPVPLTNAIVTQYYMISVAYLPLLATEARGANIAVDLVVARMPAAARRIADHVVQFVMMLAYGGLALQAWQLAQEKLARNAFLMEQTTRVSTWPSYFIIPVGFGLVALLILARLLLRLAGRPPARELAPLDMEEKGSA